MSPLLDVDKVVVGDLDPARAEDVEAAAGIDIGSPLATLDVDRVDAAVAAVPWVATATVSRAWPGSVRIEVRERRPVAVALVPDGTAVLVDAERQLAIGELEGRHDLPRLVGAVGQALPGAPLGAGASGALELAVLLDDVAVEGGEPEIHVDGQGGLDVVFPSAGVGPAPRVRFGRPVDLDDKVRTLRALLQSGALAEGEGAGSAFAATAPGLDDGLVVDVRVPSAPVATSAAP